jgi:hypothetical protein
LGSAIGKVVTRLHRTAPSLEGQPVATIEARLKDEADDILKQMHTLHERLTPWQRAVQGKRSAWGTCRSFSGQTRTSAKAKW